MIAADRHLLFGLLALQNGIINQVQLVAAFQAWTLDKSRSLADHLEARATSPPPSGRSGGAGRGSPGSPWRRRGESLAAVSAGKSTRESLARIGDPEIEATLGHVPSAHGPTDDGDADRTASYAVGSATRTASGFACSGRMHGAGWGRCSWRWTPN